MLFISVEFKGVSDPVSSLSATLTGGFISVESKRLTKAVCLSEINWAGREDIEWVGRTAWRARMVRRARKDRADLQDHYSILVSYINDYFKWFRYCGIAWRRARKRQCQKPHT